MRLGYSCVYVLAVLIMGCRSQSQSQTVNAQNELRYIVQLDDSTQISDFLNTISTQGINVKVNHRYTDIYHGVSVTASQPLDLALIGSITGVVSVHSVKSTPTDTATFSKTKNQNIPLRDNSFSIKNAGPAAEILNEEGQWDIHKTTGVDQLHRRGIKGKGVKIGLVDGGVDYRHPGLGGGFGPGYRVVGGYDWLGQSGDPTPDDDPLDVCRLSTAVAGVVFANDSFTGILGVAPEADIYAYRVISCGIPLYDDNVIAALERAYKDGMDVVYLTISDIISPGWSNNPIALATTNLVKKGVFVAMPVGNQGRAGPFSQLDSTLGKGVAAVGATAVSEVYATVAYATIGKTKYQIPYTEPIGLGAVDANGEALRAVQKMIEIPGSCNGTVPSNIPKNLSGYTVIIQRQDLCTFDGQVEGLEKYNPGAVLIYNSSPNQSQVHINRASFSILNLFSISYEKGQILSTALKNKQTVSIEYGEFRGVGVPNKQNPGSLTDFTAWGPEFTGDLWPHVVAPGDVLFSTYHINHGSYTNVAGTGPSAGYIAGVAALYYSQNGGRKTFSKTGAGEVLNRMIHTANPVKWDDGLGEDLNTPIRRRAITQIAPVSQQGGGMIDADKFLRYSKINVKQKSIVLGDMNNLNSTQEIVIENPTSNTVRYTLQHKPSITYHALDSGSPWTMHIHPGIPAVQDGSASVKFPTSQFSLSPGQSYKITVQFKAPVNIIEDLLPVYSGYIELVGSNNETISVPYQGFATNLKAKIPIWSSALPDLPVMADKTGAIQTMPGSPYHNYTMEGFDYPVFIGFNTFGTEELRIDVVHQDWSQADWAYPPQAGKKKFIGSIMTSFGIIFPSYRVSRSTAATWSYEWYGFLANGSALETGNYKIVLSALRPKGNVKEKTSWQIVESGIFGLVRV